MSYEFRQGHVLDLLRQLPAESVHTVVTSPPYFGLRDYGLPLTEWPDGWRGSLGLEPTPDLFVEHMVEVFREVRRVLRKDGTVWCNLGDSMAGSGNGSGDYREEGASISKRNGKYQGQKPGRSLPAKNLLLMPYRVMLALQDDGWIVRSQICWSKKSCMPESVQDRPTNAWEPIFLLSKSSRYFFDSQAVREEAFSVDDPRNRPDFEPIRVRNIGGRTDGFTGGRGALTWPEGGGRNQRNVWTLGPEPFSEAHFATYPTEVPRRAIAAGTSERGCCPDCGAPWKRVVARSESDYARLADGRSWTDLQAQQAYRGADQAGRTGKNTLVANGTVPSLRAATAATTGWAPTCSHKDAEPIPATVLDPFSGAGTTCLVADRLGRHGVGLELNPEYVAMAERRLAQDRENRIMADRVERETRLGQTSMFDVA